MTTLVDEAKANGTPVLHLLDPRSEDALTHERYERQLCLSLDTWARLLGPSLVKSLAMTGSDPYLRTGSDIAILFEASDAPTLETGIRMQYDKAKADNAKVVSVTGMIEGQTYQGVVTSDRSVCSYMAVWDNLVYQDQPYVRIRPAADMRSRTRFLEDLAVYYVVTPKALIVSLNETLIRRAIDRQQNPENISASQQVWLGDSMAVHVQGPGMKIAQTLFAHNTETILRERSWANLLILNEWKRRFDHQSPLTLHERLWQTKLVCPGGGDYVWNPTLHTMESTIFGSPTSPKTPDAITNAMMSIKVINMGLTFEDNGLRARVVIE